MPACCVTQVGSAHVQQENMQTRILLKHQLTSEKRGNITTSSRETWNGSVLNAHVQIWEISPQSGSIQSLERLNPDPNQSRSDPDWVWNEPSTSKSYWVWLQFIEKTMLKCTVTPLQQEQARTQTPSNFSAISATWTAISTDALTIYQISKGMLTLLHVGLWFTLSLLIIHHVIGRKSKARDPKVVGDAVCA